MLEKVRHFYVPNLLTDDSEQLLDLENLSLSECKEECKRLVAKNQSLQKEMWELNKAKDIPELTELRHAKEALLGKCLISSFWKNF